MLILLRQLGIHIPRPSFSISNCVGICCLTCSQKNIRTPNLLSFKGVPSPPSWCLQGYFHSLSINSEDIDHSVFQAASLSQAMSQDSKSYFECSVWILTVVYCTQLLTILWFSEPADHNACKHRVYIWAGSMALWPRSHEWYLHLTRGEIVPTFSGWHIVQNFRK